MGQAKRRGTFEERVAQSGVRRAQEAAAREARYQERRKVELAYHAAHPEAPRNYPRSSRSALMLANIVAAAFATRR